MTQPGSRLVPLIVASALFMENLDSSILATALPAIAASFDTSPLRLSLAISSYLLSLAIFIPVSGYCADRYGARRVFRTAIVVFTVGSLCCALAPSPAWLVAARALQGMGGAMMVPVGRLVVLRRVPKEDLVAAMAWITIPALVAPMMAPLVGGLIVTYAQWRWIFLINLPIGVLGFWLATRHVHDTPGRQPPPMDFRGWLLLALGLVAVVFAIEMLGKDLLPVPLIIAILATGVAGLTLYWRHARREAHPVVKLALLRLTTFRTSMTGGSLFRIAAGGSSFLLPLMLQVGFGLSAAQSGALTFAGAAGALLMRSGATHLVRRIGFRRLLVADAAASAALISLCLLLTPDTSRLLMLALFFSVGFCRSLMFLCVNTMGYADVPERDMSNATSFAATAQQLGLTLGVAITAQVLHVSAVAHGREVLEIVDFHAAWIVIAALTLSSLLVFRRLPPDAGNSVSGYRPVRIP